MRYYGNPQNNNNVQSPSNKKSIEEIPVPKETQRESVPHYKEKANKNFLGNILGKFSKDDLILIAIIFMLLQEDDSDTVLLIALGYIFISGL